MRKLNPDRMLKYIAKTTPDRVSFRADVLEDPETVKLRYQDEARRFDRLMTLKHGSRPNIVIYQDDMLGFHPGEIVYTLVARR
jgi:hypothetical protein